ncbi:diacylglycerol/lipid kinase family protein [Halomonas icarae]|uniref:YegS/Rv2252/BmrU family lipid kinase n=1 Tax=Halomonas icarae TaxID=2691040 RepID=A0A7X5AKW6_9GAMM|nr:YegS/Rv2252/BmrU family lipid kinase [Halomonas icarae]MDR5900974.1 YegS/Rv2252/BmrU family lipid kinase [Halomonas icarae]NAW11249.1 YegS/Rv2252/BmrU family lipid kinase [Halomonas icarae]
MRYWLIANTRAGSGSRGADFWKPRLERAGITPHQVRDLGDDAWETELDTEDTVLVAGGDGSVNLAARVCLDRGATLGVLPSGTANDFSRNLHLPEDPDALCRVIARGRIERVDVGWLDDQLFLNVVHIGLGTLPTTQASTRLKRWLGRFSYAAMLPQLRRLGLTRGFKATIHTDEERIEGRWLSLAIASGSFFGGGTRVPGASPRSGRLTLIAVRPRPWWELLWTFLVTRYKGATPSDNDSVEQYATADCRIQMEQQHRITADGELLGKFAELQLRIDKGALPVITGKR